MRWHCHFGKIRRDFAAHLDERIRAHDIVKLLLVLTADIEGFRTERHGRNGRIRVLVSNIIAEFTSDKVTWLRIHTTHYARFEN